MTHQDRVRKCAAGSHAHDLARALKWLLGNVSLTSITLRPDCNWTPLTLAVAALLWAWSDEKTLGDRFRAARKITMRLFPQQQEPAGSYQAFMKLLRKWTDPYLLVLKTAFRQQMQEALAEVWRVGGWLVFACDGSRIGTPRTRANELRYSPKSKLSRAAQKRRRAAQKRKNAKQRKAQEARERKANIPQIWLTVLWHVGSGLPWDWRTGPADSAERQHLVEMLPGLPKQSLVTADAGFVGYDLWKAILDSGHQLLARVGGNVRLLKNLGYVRERAGLVYLWPEKAAKKNLPPLVLRLVVVHNGRHPVYLVTSVRDTRELSDTQVAAIYRKRWGIELFYRHCKQTFERRTLRSHNPDNALVELQWSLLGVWAIGLHSHHHLVSQGVPVQKISFANTLRAYRKPMREYKSDPDEGESLTELLDRAILDNYERKNKASRGYPRKKQEKAAGPPVIVQATAEQVQRAREVKQAEKKKAAQQEKAAATEKGLSA